MSWQTQNSTVVLTMGDQTLTEILFDRAVESVRNTIPAERQWILHSDGVASLSDRLSMVGKNDKNDRVLEICKKSIIMFMHRFEPYFEFIRVFVQVKPEWRQTFWGLTSFIFETASIYALFVDKIAGLFEGMTQLLPDYQQLHAAYQGYSQLRSQHRCEENLALLSYVYADIMQLFLELYQMFSRVSHGVAPRHVRLTSPISLWRPLDSRFARLEARLVHHKVWLGIEFGSSDQNHATIARHRREYIELMSAQVEVDGGEELMKQRMAKRMRRVHRCQAWIDSDYSYRDVYEHRLKQRHPNTCTWFLEAEKYRHWKNGPFGIGPAHGTESFEDDWQHRVLFVQAEPGFGKSFLSGAVIDDLSNEAGNLSIGDDQESPSVAFYHFNAAHSYCTHPDDSFRALTDQLLHIHLHDRSTLDAVSLLLRKAQLRTNATPDEVLSLLALLLRKHPTFLVVDGIDECGDVEFLLRCFAELCKKSDTRVIFFSRPHIKIPLEYQKWASDAPHIMSLDNNRRDVETYIMNNLNELADSGYFGISVDRSLVTSLAQGSKGNFLWAGSLLKYLRSSVLSPDERRTTLERYQELDGLDAIYGHILALLEKKRENEKRFVAGVFRLLALSIHQPCTRGLQKALNVVPGHQTLETGTNFIAIEAIPLLSCGLIEVTPCNVIFTHKSVREFLQTLGPQKSSFGLRDESLAHAHLAALCISFLAFDIPKRPLGPKNPRPFPPQLPAHIPSSSSGTSTRTTNSSDSGYKSLSSAASALSDFHLSSPASTPTRAHNQSTPSLPHPTFDADLPFLRYASLCWPIHLTRALAPSPFPHHPAYPWLTSLSTFLTDRAAVTTWVEASWRYNLPPSLSRLVPLLEAVKSRTPPATVEGRELRWVVHGVRELSEGLRAVREGWGTRVREDPGLVWGWRGGRGMM